jgi:hypothetical protein
MTLDEYLAYNKLGLYSPGRLEMTNKPSPEGWADEREGRPQEHLETTSMVRRRRTAVKDVDSVDWVEAGGVVPVKNQGTLDICSHCTVNTYVHLDCWNTFCGQSLKMDGLPSIICFCVVAGYLHFLTLVDG